MKRTFSSLDRALMIAEIQSIDLDLLIIGGGITGAGILLDAVTRGMRALLIDMQDFAAGTSSRSTKLVHGGLRYLKQLDIRLVAQVGRERSIVFENGPHVTMPLHMLLPIRQGGPYGRLATSLGLFVYDSVAKVRSHERRTMLRAEEALSKEPLLRREGLKGAGWYVEYRTDDARLTLEILKEAVQRGGMALNYMRAETLLYQAGKLIGAETIDEVTGDTYRLFAKKVVNATGPWCDELREKDKSKQRKYLHHTKGVHIVVDEHRFPLRNAVYFEEPGGRMIFAIPRNGKAYIGTTDTEYHGDLHYPTASSADIEYLIRAVNFMFPSVHLTVNDVQSSWAGIRPLIHEDGKSLSEISRRDEIFRSPTGLITIAGGKLTGYRRMAEKVVDMVATELWEEYGIPLCNCVTRHTPISGGDVGGSLGFDQFVEEATKHGVEIGLDRSVAETFGRRYGSNFSEVLDIIRSRSCDSPDSLPNDVFGPLMYAIYHEMCQTPSDFFIRRTGGLWFNIEWVELHKAAVVDHMTRIFMWDEDEHDKHVSELELRIQEATNVLS